MCWLVYDRCRDKCVVMYMSLCFLIGLAAQSSSLMVSLLVWVIVLFLACLSCVLFLFVFTAGLQGSERGQWTPALRRQPRPAGPRRQRLRTGVQSCARRAQAKLVAQAPSAKAAAAKARAAQTSERPQLAQVGCNAFIWPESQLPA